MAAVLSLLLWLFIGSCASMMMGFVSVFPIYRLLKLTDAFGRRRGQQAKQRISNALVVVSVLMPLMVALFWLAAVLVADRLDLRHATALQFGAVIGASGMGCLLWVFIGASLAQTIKDP